MSQYFLRVPDKAGTTSPVIGKNSEQFSYADPLTIDSNGFLARATSSGEKIWGFSLEDVTMASDNQTVAKYKPLVIPFDEVVMVFTADQAVTQTDIGAYADIVTSTSGGYVLNFAAGATGQFFCQGFDPNNDGSTTLAIVRVAEPQVLAFAQS
mgnify:CR=1 FL=1